MFQMWAKSIAASLRAESQIAGRLIHHPGRRGSEREWIVRAALSRILPADVEVGTGQVIDSTGNVSKQIDIIVARKSFPVIRFNDGSANYVAESVIATIEVKSTLDRKGLEQGLANCQSVTKLAVGYLPSCLPDLEKIHNVQLGADCQPNGSTLDVRKFLLASKPATYVLAYHGARDIWRPFSDWYRDQVPLMIWDVPSLIVSIGGDAEKQMHATDLNFIVRNDDAVVVPATGTCPHAMAGHDSDPFALFILHMLRTVLRACASSPTPMGFTFSARSHIDRATFGATQGLGDLSSTLLG